MKVLADTHAILWYVTADVRLSVLGRQTIEEAESEDVLAISSITVVESTYLYEKIRITDFAWHAFQNVINRSKHPVEVLPVDHHVANHIAAVPREQVPDMPDRIIAATALAHGCSLVSRDGKIRTSSVPTIW